MRYFTLFYGIPENQIPIVCFGISRYPTTSNNGIRRYKYRNCRGVLTIALKFVSTVCAARCSWYRVRCNIVRGIKIHPTSRTRYRVHSSSTQYGSMVRGTNTYISFGQATPVVYNVWCCGVCRLHDHQTTAPPRATDYGPCNHLDNRTKGMQTVVVFTAFNPLHSVVVNERHIMYTWSNINHVKHWLLADDVLTIACFP